MQNSVAMSILSVFDQKYHFCFWPENLVQKVKIVSLSWHLVSRLIRTYWIQSRCWLFLFLTGNTIFLTNLILKIKIVSLSWNLVSKLIWICTIQWWCYNDGNNLLGQIWSQNSKFLFKAKFGTFTNSSMQNSMGCSLFLFYFVLFFTSFVQKVNLTFILMCYFNILTAVYSQILEASGWKL